jgi:hypothetical protein
MVRCCEVCAALGAGEPVGGSARPKLRRVLIEDRIVALCDVHADAVAEDGIGTLAALRSLFPEPLGRRSLVSRRSPLDRRVFPVRPEGRRRSFGRRADDRE